MDAREQVQADTLEDWRQWLALNHAQPASIWLCRWKKGRGPYLPYADARDEALCWGWIDGLPRKLDAERSLLLMSPRRPRSAWSKVNRERVASLGATGRMMQPGLAAVARAKADGSWDRLAGTDSLACPPDLAAALAALPPATERFEAFSPSSRRAILEWLALARRPETRARRIEAIAGNAAQGLRVNFPEGGK